MCNFIYEDDLNEWTSYDKGTTIQTCVMNFWWIFILICFYKVLPVTKILLLSKCAIFLIIFIILPIQLVSFFVFGYFTIITTILRLFGSLGFIMHLVVIFLLKKEEKIVNNNNNSVINSKMKTTSVSIGMGNTNDGAIANDGTTESNNGNNDINFQISITRYEFWFILVFCGPISYLIASIVISQYFIFRFTIYQYFWFVAFWIYYIESLPYFKFYNYYPYLKI